MSPGRSVMSPTLRSVRRSSELSGPTLVNTSSVVLKAMVTPERRKIFEAGGFCFEPAMASVAYRGRVEERNQAIALGPVLPPQSNNLSHILMPLIPGGRPCDQFWVQIGCILHPIPAQFHCFGFA